MSDHERAANAARSSSLLTMRTHTFHLALPAALVLVAAAWAGSAQAAATTAAVQPTQRLAKLVSAHKVFSGPGPGSVPLRRVSARRPLTGERTVLPVLGSREGTDGLRWFRVRLPGRPNGRTGWIRERKTTASTTAWHVVVNIAERRVIVYRQGRPVRAMSGIVGKPSTPTPHGEFFVEEDVQLLRSSDIGGPFAIALSARSDVFQEFEGGPGQIALHGLVNVGGTLGTAASHGCVRLDNDAMRWLVQRIGPGVPVTVTG